MEGSGERGEIDAVTWSRRHSGLAVPVASVLLVGLVLAAAGYAAWGPGLAFGAGALAVVAGIVSFRGVRSGPSVGGSFDDRKRVARALRSGEFVDASDQELARGIAAAELRTLTTQMWPGLVVATIAVDNLPVPSGPSALLLIIPACGLGLHVIAQLRGLRYRRALQRAAGSGP